MQRYIYENPASLPLEDIREDLNLHVICREFPTSSGPIDALALDDDGALYVIETKLFKNPDKRQVIAQALDYGAALWHDWGTGSTFLDKLDQLLAQRSLPALRKQLENAQWEQQVIDDVLISAAANQEQGRFRFVILMDRLDDRLRNLITFINQNSRFTVYGVELEFYRHNDLEVVLPRLHGAEVKKEVDGTTSGRGRWSTESFFADAARRLSASGVDAIRQIYSFSDRWCDDLSWGNGTKTGSINPKRQALGPKALYTVCSDGRLVVNFPYFDAELHRDRVAKLAQALRDEGVDLPVDFTKRHVTIPIDQWSAKLDCIQKAVTEFVKGT